MGYSDLRFYVYVHKYASGPRVGRVFYVGKGRYGRALERKSRSKYWQNIVRKYGYTHEIIMRFNNEACAFSIEIALIAFYGRENLCNLSIGGEGPVGAVRSLETKKRLSDAHKGKTLSDDHKRKIREATQTKDHRSLLSSILLTPNVRQKLVTSSRCQFSTKESRAKHSKACGGKPVKRSDGEIFPSVSEAARMMTSRLGKKCAGQNIDRAARKEGYTAFGYGWEFIDDV